MNELWDAVVDTDNLWNAWEEVHRRNSRAGIDGQSVAEFARFAPSLLSRLSQELRRGAYRPQPLQGAYIPKASGGWRQIGIPTVTDRVAQRACLNVLSPLLEPELEECSYAYRPGRKVEDALHQIERWRDKGHRHLLESDIHECFDSIDRELLLSAVHRYVPDKRILELIASWLECGTAWISDGSGQATPMHRPCGIPQGSALSPLLCNLFLDAFDEALLRKRFKLVRYSDDFLILATRRDRAEDALQVSREALAHLGLRLHPEKTRLACFAQGFRYLGMVFQGDLMLAPGRYEAGASGYPQAPVLSPGERPVPPPAPVPDGTAVLAGALAQARIENPSCTLIEPLEAAMQLERRRARNRIRREAAAPWVTSYLV